jgi:hypothetical protein
MKIIKMRWLRTCRSMDLAGDFLLTRRSDVINLDENLVRAMFCLPNLASIPAQSSSSEVS